jgi:hypothetical protein
VSTNLANFDEKGLDRYNQLTENFSAKFLYESDIKKNLCGMPVIDAAN